MLKAKKSLIKFHRNNKIIAIVCGAIYALYGLINIGMVALQEKFLYNDELLIEDFAHEFIDPLHNNIKLMMPYLIAIGVAFLIFGLLYRKVKYSRLAIALVILVACILWSVLYIKSGIEQIDLIYGQMEELIDGNDVGLLDKFSDVSRYMGTMGLLMAFVYMVGPIAILTLRIKLNDAEE